MRANINERNKVFFVANSYGFTCNFKSNLNYYTILLIKIPDQNFNNLKRMVLPSGAQAILMFSPLVEMVAAAFDDLDSQIRTCFKKRKNNGFYLIIIINFIFTTEEIRWNQKIVSPTIKVSGAFLLHYG